MRISREELLHSFEAVQPGLSPREVLEQSSCFVIKEGRCMTFNDEIACTAPIKLGKTITGAVQAGPLLKVLAKMVEEEVDVEAGDGELIVKGKRKTAKIRMEKEIMLPIDQLEPPGEWVGVDSEFSDALALVHECAGRDLTQFAMACVHITPKWVEACDNFQLMRYLIKTGISSPTLVKRDSIKHVVAVGIDQFSESPSWLHFKNSAGLIISCRRFVEDYLDLAPLLKVKGDKVQLPKGIAQAAGIAEIFSAENQDNNNVTVELMPGKLRIKGQGVSGSYQEVKDVKYAGQAMSFLIAPKLLGEITAKHNECQVTAERLMVDGGRWRYVACLGAAEVKEDE